MTHIQCDDASGTESSFEPSGLQDGETLLGSVMNMKFMMKIRAITMFMIVQVALARAHTSSRSAGSRLSYLMQLEHADKKFVQQIGVTAITHPS